MELWRAADPLVLASKSSIRRALLAAAGIAVEVVPSDIDERAVEGEAPSKSPAGVAALLARAKASAVARSRPGRLVLGADQVLARRQAVHQAGRSRCRSRSTAGTCRTDPRTAFSHCLRAGCNGAVRTRQYRAVDDADLLG